MRLLEEGEPQEASNTVSGKTVGSFVVLVIPLNPEKKHFIRLLRDLFMSEHRRFRMIAEWSYEKQEVRLPWSPLTYPNIIGITNKNK